MAVTYDDLVKSGYGGAAFNAVDQGTTFADLGTYDLIGGRYGGPTQMFTAPLSNKGNPTSQISKGTNTFAASPETSIRLVDNATGKVVFEGVGYEAAQKATDLAQQLSDTKGNKANWDIQASTPGMSGYATVANEKANKSALGTIADIGLPILASALIPGGGLLGTILPAAAGSAASSVAQGRDLGDTLLRAAMAGGGAGLGEKFLSPAINAALKPATTAATQVGTNLAAQTAAEAAAQAAGEGVSTIFVNGIPQLVSSVGSALGSTLASGLNNVASNLTGTQPTTPPNMDGDIVVTAGTQPGLNFGGAIGALPLTPTPPVETPPVVEGDITVTAPKYTPPVAPPIYVPPGIFPPTTPPTTPPEAPTEKPPADKKDVLGTGLTAGELALIGSLGSSVIGSLFGGGGGADTSGPYVSPFGAGVGFGAGQDMRANPNILDYERYGFGPEAMFFRPEYNQLLAGAPAPQAQPAATTNPVYTPLI